MFRSKYMLLTKRRWQYGWAAAETQSKMASIIMDNSDVSDLRHLANEIIEATEEIAFPGGWVTWGFK